MAEQPANHRSSSDKIPLYSPTSPLPTSLCHSSSGLKARQAPRRPLCPFAGATPASASRPSWPRRRTQPNIGPSPWGSTEGLLLFHHSPNPKFTVNNTTGCCPLLSISQHRRPHPASFFRPEKHDIPPHTVLLVWPAAALHSALVLSRPLLAVLSRTALPGQSRLRRYSLLLGPRRILGREGPFPLRLTRPTQP